MDFKVDKNPINNERVIRILSSNLWWLTGNPRHNGQHRGLGECSPDFSCCYPDLLSDPNIRIKEVLGKMKDELIRFISERELDSGQELDTESQNLILRWIDCWFEDLIYDTVDEN